MVSHTQSNSHLELQTDGAYNTGDSITRQSPSAPKRGSRNAPTSPREQLQNQQRLYGQSPNTNSHSATGPSQPLHLQQHQAPNKNSKEPARTKPAPKGHDTFQASREMGERENRVNARGDIPRGSTASNGELSMAELEPALSQISARKRRGSICSGPGRQAFEGPRMVTNSDIGARASSSKRGKGAIDHNGN